MKWMTAAAAGMVLAASATATRAADDFAVELSLGYSRLEMDGKNSKALDGADGAASRITFMAPAPHAPGFRFGFGLTGSAYRDEFHVTDSDGDTEHRYRELDLFIPELRVAYFIPIHDFFIEPNFGLGLAVGDYRQGEVHHHHHDDFNDDEFDDNHDDIYRVNVSLRPGIKIGYGRGPWAAGVEASYLWTHLHFDEGVGGDIGEAYVGGFFRWTF